MQCEVGLPVGTSGVAHLGVFHEGASGLYVILGQCVCVFRQGRGENSTAYSRSGSLPRSPHLCENLLWTGTRCHLHFVGRSKHLDIQMIAILC